MRRVFILFTEEPDMIQRGKDYILVSRQNVNTGVTQWALVPDNGKGISDNVNYNVKRYHGACGISFGWVKCAHGSAGWKTLPTCRRVPMGAMRSRLSSITVT